MTQIYPSALPTALVQDYRVEVAHGVTAVAFERGNTRQRKRATTRRHVFGLSMVFTVPELWTWQSWANRYGFDWHYMNLISSYSGAARAIPHLIRYIGDISVQTVDLEHVRVSVEAEMDINTLPLGEVIPTGDWIIGGAPDDPSADFIIGVTPASPSTDFIIAGSPGVPA